MEYVSYASEPKQAIRATERLGFYETAAAMRAIAGLFQVETPQEVCGPPTVAGRIRFVRFRSRFNPFE